jgi:hypothetical protein
MSHMYSPLPASEPRGPVVRSRLAPPLRFTLRLYSTAIGAVGVALLAATAYMYLVFHRTGLTPPDPPAPAPAPHVSLWFLWTTGSAGAACLAVASSGLAGQHVEARRRLFFHLILLSLLLLAQAAALVVLFAEPRWRSRLPEDATGYWERVVAFAETNEHIVKLAALGAMLAQLVGLGTSSGLHSIYQSAYDDWIDGVEAAQARASEQLAAAAEAAYAGTGPSTWNTRAGRKYGLTSGGWRAEAAAAEEATASVLAPAATGTP